MARIIDMTGQRFGRLTVVERLKNDEHGTAMWLCRCDCGNSVAVRGGDLRKKNGTKSCGCLAKEVSKNIHKTHGRTKSRLYRVWRKMLERCNNPKHIYYQNYGGRGITVCEEWLVPDNFFEWALSNGYSDNLSIDRIDTNGNYEPSNCRWATAKEQSNNKRNNHMITMNGKTQNVTQWCEELGFNQSVIYKRLSKGMDIRDVFKK